MIEYDDGQANEVFISSERVMSWSIPELNKAIEYAKSEVPEDQQENIKVCIKSTEDGYPRIYLSY